MRAQALAKVGELQTSRCGTSVNHSISSFSNHYWSGKHALIACCVLRCQVGWFPTYTITEDYALSMELRKAGCTGRYLPLNLAVRPAGVEPRQTRPLVRQLVPHYV